MMPTYEITAPNGKKYRVTAPDGATQAEVLAYVQNNANTKSAAELGAEQTADEYGPVGAGMVAAGRTLDRLYQGAKQSALQIPALFGSEAAKSALARQEADEEQKTASFSALERKRPVASLIGGAAPLFFAPVLGGGVLGLAASASLPGMIEYGSPEERLARGAAGFAGGAVGGGVAKALEKVVRPIASVPGPATTAAVDAAERIGYRVPVGQQTESRAVQAIEQQLAKNPFSAGAAQTVTEANQRAVNRAAAKAMGEDAPALTDDVLAAAKARIGQQFDDVASRNTVDVGKGDLFNALVKLENEQKALGSFADPSVSSLIDKGLDLAARGQVDGKTYQVIRSSLGKKAESAFNGNNSELGLALKQVQRALDDAANQSISAADRAAWAEARSQYKALKLLSKRGNVVEGGNVSPARLSSKIDKTRGDVPKELRDIGLIGETFKPLADSGTASNAVTQALISGGAGLMGPIPLLTSIAAPKALQSFLHSDAGRKYLTQGMLNLTDKQKRLLELTGAGLLSAPATLSQ